MRMPPSSVPLARPIGQALADSASLARLTERLRESNARFADAAAALPAPLRASVRPGPLDDEGWALLVPNAAVAAKLRHCLPRVAQVLQTKGWAAREIRVKVLVG